MKISAKAEYACLALLELAERSRDAPPLRIREISRAQSIPERYLVQILLQLKAAGLVVSTRGASGGYRLSRPAARITLGDILDVIDGPDPSAEGAVPETRPAARVLSVVWQRVRAAERSVLDATTIAELVEQNQPHEWTI